MLRTADPRTARATTARTATPPELLRAFNPSGRAVATEGQGDDRDLAQPSGAGQSFDRLLRGEQPVRANAPRPLSRHTVAATWAAELPTQADLARQGAARLQLEKPTHSWIPYGSTDPYTAAVNRRLKRKVAVQLGRADRPVLLAGGPNPIDLANGLVGRERGLVHVNQRTARPGTPGEVFNAPDELVGGSKGETPAALGRGTVDGQPQAQAAGGGGGGCGFERIAFLAGAVFVAWLALKAH